MVSSKPSRKRKDISAGAESEDEKFEEGLLDGVLSQSDEDSEVGGVDVDDDSDADTDSVVNTDGDEEEDAVFSSDETPSELSADEALEATVENGRLGSESEDEPNFKVVKDANGNIRYEYQEIDPIYDSDDTDAQEPANTIGNIPLSFYDSYPHIGYDINGKKIMRPATGEALDALLDSIEVPKGWTGLTDPATGKPLNLSQDELELLRRIQMNEVPEEGYDPYPVR